MFHPHHKPFLPCLCCCQYSSKVTFFCLVICIHEEAMQHMPLQNIVLNPIMEVCRVKGFRFTYVRALSSHLTLTFLCHKTMILTCYQGCHISHSGFCFLRSSHFWGDMIKYVQSLSEASGSMSVLLLRSTLVVTHLSAILLPNWWSLCFRLYWLIGHSQFCRSSRQNSTARQTQCVLWGIYFLFFKGSHLISRLSDNPFRSAPK